VSPPLLAPNIGTDTDFDATMVTNDAGVTCVVLRSGPGAARLAANEMRLRRG
jgi:hypothetical protein